MAPERDVDETKLAKPRYPESAWPHKQLTSTASPSPLANQAAVKLPGPLSTGKNDWALWEASHGMDRKWSCVVDPTN